MMGSKTGMSFKDFPSYRSSHDQESLKNACANCHKMTKLVASSLRAYCCKKVDLKAAGF